MHRFPNYVYIRITNMGRRYHRTEKRTIVIRVNKKGMKKDPNAKNLWDNCKWYCNCNKGLCSIVPCSHAMSFLTAIWGYQVNLNFQYTKLHRIVKSKCLDGSKYENWRLKHEKTCISNCSTYGYDKETMLQCDGCKGFYHPSCISKDPEQIEKMNKMIQNNKRGNVFFFCNKTKNPNTKCMYRRSATWISKRFNQLVTRGVIKLQNKNEYLKQFILNKHKSNKILENQEYQQSKINYQNYG